jgi:asparagine N-glycosylation enzyme membrane subunit Stt3
VMETLLSTLFFWLLIRAIVKPGSRTILAGLGLGAYLLTFVGGAFLVAVVTVWVVFEQLRSQWPRKETAPIAMQVIQIFLIALVMVAPFYRTFWMGYTIAALAGGAVTLAAIELIVRMTKSRGAFFRVFIATCAVVVCILLVAAPQQMRIVTRLMPWFSGQSGGVAELDSLFVRDGAFTLVRQWNQFGGALVLAAAAIVVLGEMAVARPEFRRNLIFFWSLVTMLMAIGQVRMTYYFGAAAALLVGFLTDRSLRTRSFIRWGAGIAVAGLVLAPNLIHAFATGPSESPDIDWQESLAWLREKTPEPFGNPDFYYGPYHSPAPEAAYSVMSWWDYGYWIMALGRRVPVTNPTQMNATAAAECLLAQNESEAAQILEKWRSRYVLLDRQLVMSADAESITGKFPTFFFYDKDASPDDYYLIVRAQDGSNRVLYRPAYFQSMLVHLFVFGGGAVDQPAGVALAFLRSDGKKFELTDLREYPSEQQALAAEAGCRLQGCLIVSASPIMSCVHLDSLHRFRPAFSSSTKVLLNEKGFRASAVQIYEVK